MVYFRRVLPVLILTLLWSGIIPGIPWIPGIRLAGAAELHILPVISPVGGSLSLERVFHDYNSSGSKNFFSLNRGRDLSDSGIFRENPALIPVWQLRSLIPAETGHTTVKMTAVVGKPAVYLPERLLSSGERTFFVRALDELAKLSPREDLRIELVVRRFPASLENTGIISAVPLFPTGSSDKSTFFEEGGPLRFLCRAENPSGDTVESVVGGEVSLFFPQPVADKKIAKGEILELSRIGLEAVPAGEIGKNYRLGTEGRYTARRDIPAGEILSLLNVMPKLSVEAGDPVRVTLRQGAVSLKMPGTSRGNGQIGESVTVRLSSGVLRDCRIEDDGEVSIE